MKKRSDRIGVMVFSVTAASFALAFLFVQFFLRSYMESHAVHALTEYARYVQDSWDGDSGSGSEMFQVQYLETEPSRKSREESEWWKHDRKERMLLLWCEKHWEELTQAAKANFGESYWYLVRVKSEWHGEKDFVLHVNFSAAEKMLRLTKLIMGALTVLCTALASFLGYRMGKLIRKEQDEQKIFFENASHELKTPLMSIQGFAEGLQKGVITDRERAYGIIMKESQKMSRMVDEILYLSRYDRGMATRNLENISMEELIGDCLDSMEVEIKKKGLSVKLDIHDRFLKADEEQMRRAVSNLISNALRYADKEIRISFAHDRLSIWDDGAELEKEELERIFQRFHTGKKGNTGIGLALAKEVIESHGFRIYAQNENGGVSLVVYFRQTVP